jgi:metal-responsive CopG/Arc/MetJ family transcriptional regulator
METPVAVHLPPELVRQVDEVARDEMRSRSNTVKWLLSEALRSREPADSVEPAEATG